MLIKPCVSFTFDCKHCEKAVSGSVRLFTLSSEGYSCGCDCGRSRLTALMDGSDITISYPCSICGERHTARAAVDTLLSGRPLPLACPNTGVAACYAGTPESIEAMDSAEADREIAEFIRQLLGLGPQTTQ